MHTLRLARRLTLAVALAAGVLLPALTSISSAADGRGTIVIHARFCVDAAAVDIYEECHDNVVSNALFSVDDRASKSTDNNGNVSFKRVVAGDHLITLTDGFDPVRFSALKAFCSNVKAGTGPNEATVRISEFPDFYARLGAGDRLVCDVYYIFQADPSLE